MPAAEGQQDGRRRIGGQVRDRVGIGALVHGRFRPAGQPVEALRLPASGQGIVIESVAPVRRFRFGRHPGLRAGEVREFDGPEPLPVAAGSHQPVTVDADQAVPVGNRQHKIDVQTLVVGPLSPLELMPFRQTPAPEKNDDGFVPPGPGFVFVPPGPGFVFVPPGHNYLFAPPAHVTLLSDWPITANCTISQPASPANATRFNPIPDDSVHRSSSD